MTKEELQKVIKILEQTNEGEAYFGIFQFGNEPDEIFIKANKQGLICYSLKLLKTAQDSDEILNDAEKNITPLNLDNSFIDPNSHVHIHYVEPIISKPANPENGSETNPWQDQAFKIGCLILVAIIIGLIITGGYTIVSWLL